MIAEQLDDAWVLDLFAGRGGLGIEARSRGAAGVTAVELNNGCAGRLRDAWGDELTVIRADACMPDRWVGARCYAVVLLDPPWGEGLGVRALEALAGAVGRVTPNATAALVHAAGESPKAAGWRVERTRRHGDGAVTVLTREEK